MHVDKNECRRENTKERVRESVWEGGNCLNPSCALNMSPLSSVTDNFVQVQDLSLIHI